MLEIEYLVPISGEASFIEHVRASSENRNSFARHQCLLPNQCLACISETVPSELSNVTRKMRLVRTCAPIYFCGVHSFEGGWHG